MIIEYGDSEIEKLCTDERYMRRKREDVAQKLRVRVNAVSLAKDMEDLISLDQLGRWHRLTGNLDTLWAGKLSKNFRLIISPVGDNPLKATIVEIIKIDDYH